jgi:sporulation protein YabP
MVKTESTPKKHSFTLEDRAQLSLSGVNEVLSFSENAVSLNTSRGALLIQGKRLNISRLNTDTGELFVTGEISLLKYSKSKDSGGIFEGLFK